MMFLPRQARDKHRESTQQREIYDAFLLGAILRMQRNRAVLSPCLVITKAEALELVDIIKAAMTETYAELVEEGHITITA
eukprot:COSAG06_NODE_104_length_23856_cov_6.259629_2_plen_80_part_00